MSENPPELKVKEERGVLYLTLNRPQRRNSLTYTLVEELKEQLREAETKPSIRAVCLEGAGDKSFCSGADLFSALSGESSPEEAFKSFASLLDELASFEKPLLAKVNGDALGGGLGLVLAADLAIAREGARFGTPEVRIGLFPMMIAPFILKHLGPKRARQMILCGEIISAEEALALGIINEIVPASELDRAAENLLQKLLEGAPLAQRLGKRALRKIEGKELAPALQILSEALAELIKTEDAAEGISAFLGKRKPHWKGK